MYLVFQITLLCFLLTICKQVMKWLHLSRLFVAKNAETNSELQEELKVALANLEKTRNATDARGEYAHMVRTMRAEQKVKDVREKLRLANSMNQLKGASIDIAVAYGAKTILSLMLFYTCLTHRYDAVLIFGDHINLQPLQGLLSSPTGIANAISVPFWAFTCHTVFRLSHRILLQ